MGALWLLATFLSGIGIGAYIERYRWLSWAKRNHPEEIDTSWL